MLINFSSTPPGSPSLDEYSMEVLEVLTTYRQHMEESGSTIDATQKSMFYFLMGKFVEKLDCCRFEESLKLYILAEEQLVDQQHNDALLLNKIEINFRITASIYKYVVQADNAIDDDVLQHLIDKLKRNKSHIFNDTQLAMRTSSDAIDENANDVDVQHKNKVSVIICSF